MRAGEELEDADLKLRRDGGELVEMAAIGETKSRV